MSAYTERSVEAVTIERIDGGTVKWSNGFSFGGVPADVLPLLAVGPTYLLETIRFSEVCGMATTYESVEGERVVDRWLWHKTDADLAQARDEMLAKFAAERQERWEKNRDAWAMREAALPLSLRRRLDRFRANGGHEFETEGWGYELVVCELAVLYAASGQKDDDAINDYARREGTSGNQHDYAKMLSRSLTDDPADEDAVANSVSALSPLTGDPDYSGATA